MIADIKNKDKAVIAKLAQFVPAQFTDADCYLVFAFVVIPNTFSNVGSDGVLF